MASQKKRVTFFLVDLYRGGGERVSLDLMRGFLERGYRIDLILMKKEGPYLEQLPKEVRVITFGTSRLFGTLPKLITYLKKDKPEALISIMRHMHLISVWAKMFARVKTKVILRVGIPFNVPNTKSNLREWLLPVLSKIFYKKADAVVAVSADIAEDLKERLSIPEDKMHVIHNPKFLEEIREKAQKPVDEPWLQNKDVPVVIAMGRLAPQKGFDLLVRAVAKISKKRNVRLIILGEGGEKDNLLKIAKENGLSYHIKIVSFQKNPYALLAKSDVFALSSRFEGMPNALIEALACGLPVVATDCVSGPKEIIGAEDTYGLLVKTEDVDALVHGIEQILNDETLRELYRKKALIRAEDFSHDLILKQYVDLIEAS